MAYTLWEFLQSDAASEVKQLTRAADFRHVYIESISVQELPVDDFIQKDELVLSTAVGCLDNPAAFISLIRAVKDAGAAALLLSFKSPAYAVPPKVLSCADAIGLPVFSIPWDLRFSEVQSAVQEAIKNKKLSVYQTLQMSLFDLYFEARPLSDAASKISNVLRATVFIMNAERKTLAQSGPALEGINGSAGEYSATDYLELEIHISGLLSGYLRLCRGPNSAVGVPLPEIPRSLLQKYICFPLALWFNRKNIEDLTTLRLKNDFVWDLAHKQDVSQIEILKQGARLHFDLNHPYTCALLRAVPPEKESPEERYASETAAASIRIENFLIQAGKESSSSVMVASRSLDFILYISNPVLSAEEVVERFLDRLHHQLTCAFPAYNFYWGISEISLKPPDFPRLYQNAVLALQYCLHSSGMHYRFTYRDTKEAQIVSALSGNEKIRQIADEILRPLRDYGEDSSLDLLNTLSTFIRCNYNTSLTARTLHIHRQSLLYRLEKIRDLTGMTLNDHQELFLLEVSLRVFSLYT